MPEGFSGQVKTMWEINHRDMSLLEEFSYEDPDGKVWTVPANSFLNGATIPQALWSIVGSPYTGQYRRASVIHDYFVGEGLNPDVDHASRRRADKMFYHACRFDGCSVREAAVLYIGVSIGTWFSERPTISNRKLYAPKVDHILPTELDTQVKSRFHKVYYNLEDELDSIPFEQLEIRVDQLMAKPSVSSQDFQ